METLSQLMSVNWDKVKAGTHIYYDHVPATIDSVILEQGAFIVQADGDSRFPRTGYHQNENDDYEDPRSLKVDVLSPHIWWYR